MVISGAVGRHRCDRMLQLDTFCGFIRAHIFDYFILLLFVCVCVCPASSSRWMGRYRLYLILFLSLAACFWVIEWNNKGGPFSKCTKFPWTVELGFLVFVPIGEKKENNFQFIQITFWYICWTNAGLFCCRFLSELDGNVPTIPLPYTQCNCISH